MVVVTAVVPRGQLHFVSVLVEFSHMLFVGSIDVLARPERDNSSFREDELMATA